MVIDGSEANPTSYSPYSNLCPISGRTGLSVYVSPTQDQQDATTYAVDWTTEAGTVYHGTVDPVTGQLTVDWATETLSEVSQLRTLNQSAQYGAFAIFVVSNPAFYNVTDVCCIGSSCKGVPYDDRTSVPTTARCYVDGANLVNLRAPKDVVISDLSDMFNYFNGTQIVYKLATPLTYQLTPTQVEALVGPNNVWSDGGNVTVAVVTPETLTNNGRAVVPTLTASADMVLKWGNYSASVQQGTSTIPQLILENGANLIYIIGTGSISFTWQEASL
jgi:hypothetical protein